jgi:2-polyprenyl-3-methyl-5-hydroxy-6-metoxy-1,4-benzoquinol methylase
LVASKDTPTQSEELPLVTDPTLLNQVILTKLNTRIYPRGELVMPCVPSMLEHYMERLNVLFQTLGRPFSEQELVQLRELLQRRLEEGFQASPHSNLVLRYEPAKPPQTGLACNLSTVVSSVADQYKTWVDNRQPPLFGSHPDAKVMAVAAEIGDDPAKTPILDIGAGTGRNTLPLARAGYLVHAIELTPAFVQQIQTVVNTEGLPVVVTQGNILDPMVRMRPAHYKLAIVAEVISHFRDADQVRLLMAKMCDVIRSGGYLLFNTFLAVDGYEPDPAVREMSQIAWSTIFTKAEITSAMEDLPLEIISEEPVFDYEKSHLPEEAWPPTGWFNNWATGRDLFPMADRTPPMELRWILCKRL